jgi:hypothetical protein
MRKYLIIQCTHQANLGSPLQMELKSNSLIQQTIKNIYKLSYRIKTKPILPQGMPK